MEERRRRIASQLLEAESRSPRLCSNQNCNGHNPTQGPAIKTHTALRSLCSSAFQRLLGYAFFEGYGDIHFPGSMLVNMSLIRSPQVAVSDHGLGWRSTCKWPRKSRISYSLEPSRSR